MKNYGSNQQTADNIRKIICDFRQCVSVTAQNKEYRLTLNNSNFKKTDLLEYPPLDLTPIEITIHIKSKSEKGVRRSYNNRFNNEKWKQEDLFEAIKGCGFYNNGV